MRKLFAKCEPFSLDVLTTAWYKAVAREAEDVRRLSHHVLSGHVGPEIPYKLARHVIVTLSRAKSTLLGCGVLLQRVLECKHNHRGAAACAPCGIVCYALHHVMEQRNATTSAVLWSAAKACQHGSGILTMASEDFCFNWKSDSAGDAYVRTARALMTEWIQLDQYATALGVPSDHLSGRGGQATFRTLHALLTHLPWLRVECGLSKSTSLYELYNGLVVKRASRAVQAIECDEIYSSRMLTETTSLAMTDIAKTTTRPPSRAQQQRRPTWRYINVAQTADPDHVCPARLTETTILQLVHEYLENKLHDAGKSEEAATLAHEMLESGHGAHQHVAGETQGGTLPNIETSSWYSLQDGVNRATTARDMPSTPLPWLLKVNGASGINCGDCVVYRMQRDHGTTIHDHAVKVHAAHVLTWVKCTYRIAGAIETEVNAIVEFLTPQIQSSNKSTVFRYTHTPGRRQGRWVSILPRASVWQRLPLTYLDAKRFLYPMFFQCVVDSGADVERLTFRP